MVSNTSQDVEADRDVEIADNYQDNSVEKVITDRDLNRMATRSLWLQASFNYERMQAGGWVYGLIPGLEKIHTNATDLKNALKDHLQFFNTHPFLVTYIQGIVLALEENKANRETIRGIKTGLMGPLGGIGDSLFYLTALPIIGGIAANLSIEGNPIGPILFLVLFNIVHLGVRYGGIHLGYKQGTDAIPTIKENTRKVSRAASIVGLAVVGAMVAANVNFTMDWQIPIGAEGFDIQTQVLDPIMPQLLPLLYTLLCFYLLRKGGSAIGLIVLSLIIGLVGSALGIM